MTSPEDVINVIKFLRLRIEFTRQICVKIHLVAFNELNKLYGDFAQFFHEIYQI